MALNWCLNECWYMAASCTVFARLDIHKPAFFSIKNPYRLVLASAGYSKFVWSAGEEFTCDFWMLNDSPNAVGEYQIEAWLMAGDKEVLLLS